MRTILITSRLTRNEVYGEVYDSLDVRWAQLCAVLGIVPVPFPSHYDPGAYFDRFDFDGVIFTGGNDLSTLSGDKLSSIRDRCEKKILGIALERSIPVLGICRGMQLVADFFGCPLTPAAHHAGTRHPILTESSSPYGEYLSRCGRVNSYHNHAVKSVADGLRVSARAEELIETGVERQPWPMVYEKEENSVCHARQGDRN